jgi:hypothetical protein
MPEAGPAPAATAAPAAAAPAAPATEQKVDPSLAGRTLREIREARKAGLGKEKPSATSASGPSSAATPQAEPSTPAREGAAPASGQPAAAPDPDAELAALIKEDRRVKAAAKDVESRAAALKDIEAVAPRIRTAQELAAKGDRMGAVRAVFAEHGDQFLKDLFWDLLKVNPAAEDDGEVDVDKLVEQKLAAREQAAKDEEERKRKEAEQGAHQRFAAVDEAVSQPGFARAVAAIETLRGAPLETIESYGSYCVSVAKAFEAAPDKYPAIKRLGVWPTALVQKAEQIRAEKHVPPGIHELLTAIEADLTGAARELAGASAPAVPAKAPASTLTPAWRQNPGTPEPDAQRARSLDEIRAERKRRLTGAA